jgi:hypothetical protein
MIKTLAILLTVASLGACSSMYGSKTAPNSGETKNSLESNKAGNGAAVSPGGSGPGASGSGSSGGAAR